MNLPPVATDSCGEVSKCVYIYIYIYIYKLADRCRG